jgi:hypothetical protein
MLGAVLQRIPAKSFIGCDGVDAEVDADGSASGPHPASPSMRRASAIFLSIPHPRFEFIVIADNGRAALAALGL